MYYYRGAQLCKLGRLIVPMNRPVKGLLYEGGSSSVKKRDRDMPEKEGDMPEKEGDSRET